MNKQINTLIVFCISFLMIWSVFISTLYYFNRSLLIDILEFLFSTDGVISNPDLALQKVIIAPFGVFGVIWANKIILNNWKTSFATNKWYLPVFFLHLIFFIIYFRITGYPQENDILETATFFLAFASGIIFFISGFLNVRIAFFIGFCFLIFAFEEISWGQSILNFNSPQFFEKYNYQGEMNLHNFLNPIFPILYIIFNLLLLSLLTWFSQIKMFSFLYKIPSVSFVIRVSDYYSLWIIPLLLSFASIFPGFEFVEQQWSIFGLCFSILLLVEIIKSRL
tara:strand:+ start:43 stop:882 length:840 start_codon:yes stop_codon:yes gene_type:complete